MVLRSPASASTACFNKAQGRNREGRHSKASRSGLLAQMLACHPDSFLAVHGSQRQSSPDTLLPVPKQAASHLIILLHLSSCPGPHLCGRICLRKSFDTQNSARSGSSIQLEREHPLEIFQWSRCFLTPVSKTLDGLHQRPSLRLILPEPDKQKEGKRMPCFSNHVNSTFDAYLAHYSYRMLQLSSSLLPASSTGMAAPSVVTEHIKFTDEDF